MAVRKDAFLSTLQYLRAGAVTKDPHVVSTTGGFYVLEKLLSLCQYVYNKRSTRSTLALLYTASIRGAQTYVKRFLFCFIGG